MYHCLKNHAARGVENVIQRSFFGTTFKTVSTVCLLKFQNYCYLVAVMFSCFFISTSKFKRNSKCLTTDASKKVLFFFVFKNYTMSKRFLKSWFVEIESWKVIELITWPITSLNSKLVDQSGNRILSPAQWLVNQRQQIHGGNFKLKGHVTRSVSYKSSNLFGHVW